MNRKWMLGSVAAVAVTGFVGASAQANHIDTFQDGAFDLDVNSPGQTDSVSQSGLDQNEVLGGSREVNLHYDASNEAPEDQISSRVVPTAGSGPNQGRLSFSAGAGEEGTLDLFYGFDDVGGTIDLESNASGGDFDGFLFNFTQADAGTDFSVTVDDSVSDTVTKTTTASTSQLIFGFDEFTGVNFNNVDSVDIEIEGAQSGDYTLAGISRTATAVPSPAALPAGLLMLGGLLVNRRRKQA